MLKLLTLGMAGFGAIGVAAFAVLEFGWCGFLAFGGLTFAVYTGALLWRLWENLIWWETHQASLDERIEAGERF